MASPLPEIYAKCLETQWDSSCNSGLLFDRAPNHWSGRWVERPSADAKKQFLLSVSESVRQAPLKDLLKETVERHKRLIEALGGRTVQATTVWRLVSGLGASHVLENGFVWDRNLGVPYLPGSSIKGMLRAWARDWTDAVHWVRYEALFGDVEDLGAGQIVVHDAFPTSIPAVELDVMTVHHSRYYRNPTQPPAGGDGPIPITFLAVATGAEFQFGLSPGQGATVSPAERQRQLDDAEELLRDALRTLGVGGKTAVGYGRFG
jgi:CRISPR-associated protein Cmr6